MAHSADLERNIKMYEKTLRQEAHWAEYARYLYTRDEKSNRPTNVLYGRFCFSQHLRFFVSLSLNEDGFIQAWFWREDPKSIGESFCDSRFTMTLLASLEMFPEMKATEFHKNEKNGWLQNAGVV